MTLRRVTDEDDKRLIFLQEVGTSNYELLESLLQGQEPEKATLAQLRTAMEQHFQPKKLLMAERFGLMSKAQKQGQTLQEYYAELQKAANSCGFDRVKDHRDTIVAMVFIGGEGLSSVETRKRLLEKEELSSKEVLEIAEAFERVGRNAPHLKQGPAELGVAAVTSKGFRAPERTDAEKGDRPPGTGRGRTTDKFIGGNKAKKLKQQLQTPLNGPRCRVCLGRSHLAKDCYFKTKAYCSICSRPGHLARACRTKKYPTRRPRQVYWCADPGDSEEELSEIEQTVSNIQVERCRSRTKIMGQSKHSYRSQENGYENRKEHVNRQKGEVHQHSKPGEEPAIMLPISVNGSVVNFELDTGASISIIDEKTWRKVGKPEIMPTRLEATAYNNSPINFRGKCLVSAVWR